MLGPGIRFPTETIDLGSIGFGETRDYPLAEVCLPRACSICLCLCYVLTQAAEVEDGKLTKGKQRRPSTPLVAPIDVFWVLENIQVHIGWGKILINNTRIFTLKMHKKCGEYGIEKETRSSHKARANKT